MRIISGTVGRQKIKVPSEVSRPSTDRLREALFSILGQYVEGAKVLDLFAGSGALGMECLSRGARKCDFVEENRGAVRVIQKNIKSLDLPNGRVIESDVFRFLKSQSVSYDLIFADPPYYKNAGDRDYVIDLLTDASLPSLLAKDGFLILEDPPSNERSTEIGEGWKLLERRKYGSCGILIYQQHKII